MNSSLSTILHVDDESNDLLLFETALRLCQSSVRVVAAGNGAEAISYLSGTGAYADRKAHPLPSLVLLDLKMPQQNGFEVLSWIRRQPQFKRLPVVVLTSSRHEADIARAYECGANSYLVKPVEHKDLVELARGLVHYWGKLNQPARTEPS